MKFRFTTQRLAAVKVPDGKRRFMVHDAGCPGLAYELRATGGASYYYYRWTSGKPVKVKVGDARAMSIDTARGAVQQLLARAAVGAPVRPAGSALTLRGAWDSYLPVAKAHKKTWAEDERRWNRHWAKFGGRRLADVPRGALLEAYDEIGRSGQYEANRCWAVIRRVYNFATDELGYEGQNPAGRLPKARRFKEQPRQRYLQPVELKPFLDALDGYKRKGLAEFFRLLLFTGVRRRNAESARWADVDFEARTWTLPMTKSGKSVVVALTEDALEILRRRRAATPESCPWVFSGRVGEGHLVEPMRAWRDILKAAKVDGLRIHDLRHTLATYLAETGAPEAVIRDILGHTAKGNITSQYTHTRLAVLGKAMEKAVACMYEHAGRRSARRAARAGA